jgi:hypothetical protein
VVPHGWNVLGIGGLELAEVDDVARTETYSIPITWYGPGEVAIRQEPLGLKRFTLQIRTDVARTGRGTQADSTL